MTAASAPEDRAGPPALPANVEIEPGVTLGRGVVFVESDAAATLVQAGAVIEAAAVIGAGVTIGQGALIRAGTVVLRSVPPNAVVEGNPATLTGYRDSAPTGARPEIVTRDASAFAGMTAPARLGLGVGGGALHLMRRIADARGSLSVGEVAEELPFVPARYFVVFDVPSAELRGEHAHRVCGQFLICLNGSCRVLLDDGAKRCEVTLDRPDLGVHMPPLVWGTQYRYSPDAVLMVFASHPYDANDYLRSYESFLEARAEAGK